MLFTWRKLSSKTMLQLTIIFIDFTKLAEPKFTLLAYLKLWRKKKEIDKTVWSAVISSATAMGGFWGIGGFTTDA